MMSKLNKKLTEEKTINAINDLNETSEHCASMPQINQEGNTNTVDININIETADASQLTAINKYYKEILAERDEQIRVLIEKIKDLQLRN